MELTAHNETKRTNNIIVFHQNICSITNKPDELNIDLQTNPTRPHLNWITNGIKTLCNKKESFISYTGMIKIMPR